MDDIFDNTGFNSPNYIETIHDVVLISTLIYVVIFIVRDI